MRGLLRFGLAAIAGLALLGGGWALVRLLQPEAPPQASAAAFDWGSVVAAAATDRFEPPASWQLDLPRDHGAHEEAPTESWTLAAHLADAEGRTFGIQFGLFRIALAAAGVEVAASDWTPREIYRGHVILLDGETGQSRAEERLSRGVLGLAGHAPDGPSLWLDDWSIDHGRDARGPVVRLRAATGGAALDLALRPEKDPLEAGGGAGGGAPFLGYAMTRMSAEGRVEIEGEAHRVAGSAWLDHVWGDLPLPVGPVAYDGLQLQLDDGSELAVFRTRRRDGGGTPTLDGYRVAAGGEAAFFASGVLSMEPVRDWRGGAGTAAYPVAWQLEAGDLSLTVAPLADDQLHAFVEPVWSGFVAAEGARGGEPVAGIGTLQLTGYSDQ